MALLDLQAMDAPASELATGSSTSGHSCNGSDLSLALCGETSELSLVACGH